jgi:hypothetical protein
MLYSGPEEIDACPTADTQGHQFPVLRTGKSDALSDARAPEKKPVIVNWTTKSSVRSQRDKTAFLPIIWPFWPSSRFTEKEKSINNPVAALMRRKTCFFGCCAEIRRRRRCEILVNYLKTAVISIVPGDVDSITPALISYGPTPSGVHKQFQKYREIVAGIFLHSGRF